MSTLDRALAYFQISMARVISSSFARSRLPLVLLRCIMEEKNYFFLVCWLSFSITRLIVGSFLCTDDTGPRLNKWWLCVSRTECPQLYFVCLWLNCVLFMLGFGCSWVGPDCLLVCACCWQDWISFAACVLTVHNRTQIVHGLMLTSYMSLLIVCYHYYNWILNVYLYLIQTLYM